MKVIALVDGSMSGGYICKVSHNEIEKILDLYYNKMKKLKTGDSVDLGKGYDWHDKTCRALAETRDFIEANKKMIETITEGFSVLGDLADKGK